MRLEDMIRDPHLKSFYQEWKRREDRTVFELLHGYVYARWTYFYIAVATGEHFLARRLAPVVGFFDRLITRDERREGKDAKQAFADGYHGKVMPLDGARQLVRVEEEIRVEDLEQVIPYAKARSIIMQNPDHILALDCPCRLSRPDPCYPLDVCLVVGEPFAGLAMKHHPERARWIDREEAVRILEEEDERGHVHHAFFKDAMLGRFYAICNCCSCCCGAMQAHRNGTPMLASSGYVASVDADLCAACGTCVAICPFDAIDDEEGIARVDDAACMGCGVCTGHCDQGAITLERAPERGEPLEVVSLTAPV